ncbi:MAG: cytochrome c oxidase subunit II [Verrucomicrobiota bacterium]|nr:cytochrome c oxidase subunit II [Verrucomicrobiota bacterium]
MDAAEKLLLMFFILAAVAMFVFVTVAWSTRLPEQEQAEVQHRGYAIRGRWFLGITLFLLAAFFATIPFFPYLAAAEALLPAEKVPVIAQQFVFIMPDHFPLNRRILFEVTSRDVNHGFGIYNPEGQLIAQTQAMPDYVNYLAVTFHQPGHYTVRCLEYCGVGHAIMQKDFTVEGASPTPAPMPMSQPSGTNTVPSSNASNPFE